MYMVSATGEMNMSRYNMTLLTDLYELTMMQGYFKSGTNEKVVFDVFIGKILAAAHMRLLQDFSR